MRLALAAALACAAGAARAEGACSSTGALSSAQLEKLLAYVRSNVGTSAVFYAPLPSDFGWTDDPRADVSAREVATDDRVESFAQNEAHAGDFVITELSGDDVWLFATHPDLCLARAFHRRHSGPPEALDVHAPAVQAGYARALRAWARDLDHSPPPPPAVTSPSTGSPATRAAEGR
ncbi:MAG TPA: hypothetical protein VKU90_08145 [Caulobacteraceae bacterium]|nr:hypothetical protein [Caulobacteraceae bacterium]